MNWLENLLTPALVRAVGYTILHSLWQGAVVALALAGLMLVLRRHSAQVRYRVTGGALALLLLLAGVTFLRYYWTALPAADVPAAAAAPALTAATSAPAAPAAVAAEGPLSTATILRYVEEHLPLLVMIWLLGLLTMTLRLLGGLAYVQRLRHYGTRPLGLLWQNRLNSLAERAGLDRPVGLLESSLVRVPVVVGHLRPLILLPLGAVAGLSAAQLEAILAHELAHVARRDYLINLLQSVAEVLFFYHPAVWFMTATLRTERENCCDDVAATLCGDPLVLARALAALAELGLERAAAPRLSMAATGPKGSLLGRVRRLVQGRTAPTFTEGFMAACVVMVGLLLLSFTAAAALANPRLAEAPRLLRNSVLRPIINAVTPAPARAICTDEQLTTSTTTSTTSSTTTTTTSDDDDPKRKNKRKAKGSSQVVVVDGAGRRGEPGTVIIEKDKKGRVTDMYVNGQRVEGAAADGRGGKGGESRTQVISVPGNGRAYVLPGNGQTFTYVGPGDFKFDSKFDQRFNSAEFRQQMKKLEVDLRQLEKLNHLQNLNFSYNGNGNWEMQRDALAAAEKSLSKARFDRDLTEAERERVEEALDRVRDQRSELRERLQDHSEAQRDREEALREREEALRERREALREEERARLEDDRARSNEERARLNAERARLNAERAARNAERARENAERARENAERARRVEEQFVQELLKDGLIKDTKNFSLSLSQTSMKVNGTEQPESVRRKYLERWNTASGRPLSGTGSVTMNRSENSSTTSITNADRPTPPAPPAPPAAPGTWRAVPPVPPVAPLPPRAPRAPRAPRTTSVNGVNLTEQLRQDGLIGAADRSYQFRLDGSEMVVNGKKQPAATADKYRKLMGGDKGQKVNLNVSVSED
ncbi:hypothetical protein EJV47_11150 [Hymenobacter gummosus]|uniref:Peptidase M56 domain-containing protein n=1 Tax=Hymenobacter gummosus TaxID=1776032 RepID=A0A3S0H746_9BACT|nr:M56 family metallopeptidase [Hymenobacter gummosus]RTQ50183.1 hypothetical protein EJV47_11150 [Hymenobacter gummosus]